MILHIPYTNNAQMSKTYAQKRINQSKLTNEFFRCLPFWLNTHMFSYQKKHHDMNDAGEASSGNRKRERDQERIE